MDKLDLETSLSLVRKARMQNNWAGKFTAEIREATKEARTVVEIDLSMVESLLAAELAKRNRLAKPRGLRTDHIKARMPYKDE